MGKADLHIHTIYSWDGTMTPAGVLKAAALAGLDVIAITDHDDIRATVEACNLAERYKIDVIPGCEITTKDGHLLALFVEKLIPAGLSAIETLLRIGEQGGIAIVPHPEAFFTGSLNRQVIEMILKHPEARLVLMGLEVYNTGLPHRFSNTHARTLACNFSLANVGNSDAHVPWGVGTGYSVFPGRTAGDLRAALINRTTIPHGDPGLIAISPILRWAWNYLLKRAGWVTSNFHPQSPLVLARQQIRNLSFD